MKKNTELYQNFNDVGATGTTVNHKFNNILERDLLSAA